VRCFLLQFLCYSGFFLPPATILLPTYTTGSSILTACLHGASTVRYRWHWAADFSAAPAYYRRPCAALALVPLFWRAVATAPPAYPTSPVVPLRHSRMTFLLTAGAWRRVCCSFVFVGAGSVAAIAVLAFRCVPRASHGCSRSKRLYLDVLVAG